MNKYTPEFMEELRKRIERGKNHGELERWIAAEMGSFSYRSLYENLRMYGREHPEMWDTKLIRDFRRYVRKNAGIDVVADIPRPLMKYFYKPGEYVVEPSDSLTQPHYVERGGIAIGYLHESGRHITPVILAPGDVLLVKDFLDGKSTGKFAKALALSVVPPLGDENLLKLSKVKPKKFEEDEILMERLERVERAIVETAFEGITYRIASKLLELSRVFGKETPNGTAIDLRLTHQNLADMVGCARESATECILQFIKEDIICQDNRKRGRILIKDAEKLKQKLKAD